MGLERPRLQETGRMFLVNCLIAKLELIASRDSGTPGTRITGTGSGRTCCVRGDSCVAEVSKIIAKLVIIITVSRRPRGWQYSRGYGTGPDPGGPGLSGAQLKRRML